MIRALEALSALTGLAAIAALILTLTATSSAIATARRESCYLLRGVVLRAVPPARAAAWLEAPSDPLHDCNRYADGAK